MPTAEKNKRVLKRKEWIDDLRALAMLFVILGHQLKGKTAYFVFTSPIKIPLFFVITGYVFNYSRKDVKKFLGNLLKKLVIPWLCLTVPFVFLRAIVKGVLTIPSGLLDIFSGLTAWYMPCCIVAEIIWFFILRIAKEKKHIYLLAILFSLIGLFFGKVHILDFAMINRALFVQIFILLGFIYKNFEPKFVSSNRISIAFITMLYFIMGLISLVIWPGKVLDVHTNSYYNYPFCFIMIILGCLLAFTIAQKTIRNNDSIVQRAVSFLGQNTITYYLLNGYNIKLVSFFVSRLDIEISFALFVVVKVIFTYIMCALETLFLLRFFPWLLGRKQQKAILLRETISS